MNKKRTFCKTSVVSFCALLSLQILLGTMQLSAQESTSQFIKATDTLVVYSDVPGLAPSEFYTIKVRSAATNNEWIECYANITRSLYNRLEPGVPIIGNKKEHYYPSVADWSHTYANIEMSKGSLVEVRISAKNGFKIKGSNFTSANVHPAHKATQPTVVDNMVTFTISNPAQIVIDINGQMDATNTGPGYSGPPVHTVALYANPVIKKPVLGSAGVYEVIAGTAAPTDPTQYTTLYFGPGVHDIGRGFKFYSDKHYYLSGDAMVYGTFYNPGPSGANNVKIYGYGTLSGDRIKHPDYDPAYTNNQSSWKMISTSYSLNFRIEGISISNSSFHTINFSSGNLKTNESFVEWVKIVTWRGNGDGIGNAHVMNDTFIRTQDDCTYVKGNKSRCVFWTDVNGAIFTMAGIPKATDRKILIEDCDVIYPRHVSYTWAGGRVFARRADQAPKAAGVTIVDVTFKDIRISDPYQTLESFQLISKNDKGTTSGSYSGIKFINITSVKTPVAGENRIIGWESSPWSDITFDNVVLGSKRITQMSDFAAMGPYVSDIKFLNITFIPEVVGLENNLIIYPNPATDKLYINAKDAIFNKVEMIDATGKVVYSNSNLTKNQSVDVSGLIGGLYFIKLHTSSGLYTSKFIKK